jgi:glycosyltransferase involved in cell wall biosynthesis
MARIENSDLARIEARLENIETRLARIEQTARSRRPWRDKFRPRFWHSRWPLRDKFWPPPWHSRRPWRDKFRPRLWHYRQYAPQVLRVPAGYAAQAAPESAPRIAIVTPSYNQARYLRATIDSVLAQSYPNLAYIVEDGGSTDGALQLLESYGDQIVWRSERDTGQASAVNRGFTRIDGEIMAYLNSDDVLLPGTLAYVAQAFLADPDVDIVYGHRIFIDADGSEIGRWVLPPHEGKVLKWADYIPQETMFWRRRVWDKVGQIDESFHYALDWDFVLRAQAAGFHFRRLPRFLACFRVHDEQKSTAMAEVGNNEQRRLRQAHLGYDPDGGEIHRAIRGYLHRHVLFHGLYRWGLLKY